MLRWLWQPFYTAWVVLYFLATLLIGTPLVALAAIPGGAAARRRVWRVVHVWCRLFLWATGMPPTRLGKQPPPGRYVVVLNHQSYIDSVVLVPAVPGYFRPLGKAEMARFPLFGFVYRQLVLLVDRSSPHSRARSMRLMARALRREGSVAIFPEGTFNETDAPVKEFYDGAFRLALAAGAPILPVLLPDTAKRWHWSAWWKLSPGRNRIVYLDPIPTAGLPAGAVASLREQVREKMAAGLQQLKNEA